MVDTTSNEGHSSLSGNSRSRNGNAVGHTTNGATTGHILNINTASDINIYNNQFIVNSSPKSNNQPGPKNSNRSHMSTNNSKKLNKITNNPSLGSTQNGQRSSAYRAVSTKPFNDRSGASSILSSTGQPNNLNPAIRQDNQPSWSVS